MKRYKWILFKLNELCEWIRKTNEDVISHVERVELTWKTPDVSTSAIDEEYK
jgi:hypothetical protein